MAGRWARRSILVTMLCGLLAAASVARAERAAADARSATEDRRRVAPPPSCRPEPSPRRGCRPWRRSNGLFPFLVFVDRYGESAKAERLSTPNSARLLDKVSAYLSSVQTLVGNFVQVGPDGRRVDGTFYIQKPGKVRFEYNPPSPIDIIADGSSVVVRDRSLETQDFYPLSQTPLRYPARRPYRPCCATPTWSASSADDTFITVVIEETTVVIGTNRLMIMFDAKNLQLKQWTVTDPQGLRHHRRGLQSRLGRSPIPTHGEHGWRRSTSTTAT